MRVIEEIPNPDMKITLFAWNGKFILKFEIENLEQTYKVRETDIPNANAAKSLLTETFLTQIKERFRSMAEEWYTLIA